MVRRCVLVVAALVALAGCGSATHTRAGEAPVGPPPAPAEYEKGANKFVLYRNNGYPVLAALCDGKTRVYLTSDYSTQLAVVPDSSEC